MLLSKTTRDSGVFLLFENRLISASLVPTEFDRSLIRTAAMKRILFDHFGMEWGRMDAPVFFEESSSYELAHQDVSKVSIFKFCIEFITVASPP